MKPNAINATAAASRRLQADTAYGTPEAFLLAWVAWEALKFRVLAVGLVRLGWQMKTVEQFFTNSNLFEKRAYNDAFARVFGKAPQQQPKGIGSRWQTCEAARERRHKFVHGLGSTRPSTLAAATDVLLDSVENLEWLAPAQIVRGDGEAVALGNVMTAARVVGVRPLTQAKRLFEFMDTKPRSKAWDQ